MTGRDLVVALRTRWRAFVAAFLAVAIAGLAFALLSPVQYTGKSTLFVAPLITDSPNNAYQGGQYAREMTSSYVQLANSERVAQDVAVRLNTADSVAQLQRQISTFAAPETATVIISATAPSPQEAASITNAAADSFVNIVRQAEAPDAGIGRAPVSVRVIQPAVEAVDTSLPNRTIAIVTAIGAVLAGVAAACLRYIFDTAVRDESQLANCVDSPSLGVIASDPISAAGKLVVVDERMSSDAERYRVIRNNMQFLQVDEQPKAIIFTSCSAGEGKTTTALNMALAVGQSGRRVLLIDADLRRPTIAKRLGVETSVGLTSVLAGRLPLERACQSWRGTLDVLSSGPIPPNPSELLSSNQMASTLRKSRGTYDLILIDAPPGLVVSDVAALAPASDGVIVVARYATAKTADLARLKSRIEQVAGVVLGTVLTQVPRSSLPRHEESQYYRYRSAGA